MEQSPYREANNPSSNHENLRILWNPEVSLPYSQVPVPILSQIDRVRAPISHVLKIHLNIILPSTPEYYYPLCFIIERLNGT
jgi:hypothetical protein